MKTTHLSLLFASSLFFLGVNAQSQNALPIHVGLKGGANYSNLNAAGGLNSKYAAGYFGGAMARLDLGRVYLQTELLYSEKTSKIEIPSTALSLESKWKSLEMPLVVGFKILSLDHLNVRVFGGGVYSYVINDNITGLNNLKSSYENFDKSNVSYQVGTGVDIWKFTVDLTYEGALNNISKDFKSKAGSVNMSLGYFFF